MGYYNGVRQAFTSAERQDSSSGDVEAKLRGTLDIRDVEFPAVSATVSETSDTSMKTEQLSTNIQRFQ